MLEFDVETDGIGTVRNMNKYEHAVVTVVHAGVQDGQMTILESVLWPRSNASATTAAYELTKIDAVEDNIEDPIEDEYMFFLNVSNLKTKFVIHDYHILSTGDSEVDDQIKTWLDTTKPLDIKKAIKVPSMTSLDPYYAQIDGSTPKKSVAKKKVAPKKTSGPKGVAAKKAASRKAVAKKAPIKKAPAKKAGPKGAAAKKRTSKAPSTRSAKKMIQAYMR